MPSGIGTGRQVIVGVGTDRPVPMPAARRAALGRLEIELCGIEAHVPADKLANKIAELGIALGPVVGRVLLRRVLDAAHHHGTGLSVGTDVEHLIRLGEPGAAHLDVFGRCA